MRYAQKIEYLIEQLGFLESAICKESHEKYLESFGGEDRISLLSREANKALMYQHFKFYEGPILARYTVIFQLYSLFERYAVQFSNQISSKKNLLSISDLNGQTNFSGIRTYYSKVAAIQFDDWAQLDSLRHVRNLIAHCDGYVEFSDRKTKLEKLIKGDNDLTILDDERLALRDEYIKRSMRAVVRFFDIVEPMAGKCDGMLDLSWGHINQFREFDLG